MATTKLTNETMVEVINTSSGSAGYIPEMSTVSKKWERQGAIKKVKLGELRDVIGTTGGYVLFSENILLIKDEAIREELGLPELDEYVLTDKEIKDLLNTKSADDLEDVVQNCSEDMLDTITMTAIKEEVSDLNKIKVIEDYTGVDVVDAIKELREENPKAQTSKRAPKKASTAKDEAKPKRAPKKKAE